MLRTDTPKQKEIADLIEEIGLAAGALMEAYSAGFDSFDYDTVEAEQEALKVAVSKARGDMSEESRLGYVLAAQSVVGVTLTHEEEAQIQEADSGPAANHFVEIVRQMVCERSPMIAVAMFLSRQAREMQDKAEYILMGREDIAMIK